MAEPARQCKVTVVTLNCRAENREGGSVRHIGVVSCSYNLRALCASRERNFEWHHSLQTTRQKTRLGWRGRWRGVGLSERPRPLF
jgi:hypothetical protein